MTIEEERIKKLSERLKSSEGKMNITDVYKELMDIKLYMFPNKQNITPDLFNWYIEQLEEARIAVSKKLNKIPNKL